MGICISIWRRRTLSKRRQRRELEEERANGNLMAGPMPFVPRFFPGTVASEPPPYVEDSSVDTRSATTASTVAIPIVDNSASLRPPPVSISQIYSSSTQSPLVLLSRVFQPYKSHQGCIVELLAIIGDNHSACVRVDLVKEFP